MKVKEDLSELKEVGVDGQKTTGDSDLSDMPEED